MVRPLLWKTSKFLFIVTFCSFTSYGVLSNAPLKVPEVQSLQPCDYFAIFANHPVFRNRRLISNSEDFDPEKIFSAKGLDPNAFTFHFYSSSNFLIVKAIYNKKLVGSLLATRVEVSGRQFFGNPFADFDASFHGKGLGSLMYVALSRLIQERHGLAMISSANKWLAGRAFPVDLGHSYDAEILWQRMLQNGWATIKPVVMDHRGPRGEQKIYYVLNSEKFKIKTERAMEYFRKHAIEEN